jgi:hypothetical protein
MHREVSRPHNLSILTANASDRERQKCRDRTQPSD